VVISRDSTDLSATAPCAYDAGTRTVSCDVGTIGIGETSSVAVTVLPTTAGVAIDNTATVTPDDATPDDNTSTWMISGENVTVAGKNVTPVAPPAPVALQPAFTG